LATATLEAETEQAYKLRSDDCRFAIHIHDSLQLGIGQWRNGSVTGFDVAAYRSHSGAGYFDLAPRQRVIDKYSFDYQPISCRTWYLKCYDVNAAG